MRTLISLLTAALMGAMVAIPSYGSNDHRGRGRNDNGHSRVERRDDHRKPSHNHNYKKDHNRDKGHNPGHRPSVTPPRHDNGNHYGHYNPPRRPHPVRPPHWTQPPRRPHLPVARPWRPPVRPAHFRPAPHAPRLSTILGIALGSAINHSIDLLLGNGYNVTGYGNDVVHLINTPMYGYSWPDATMYYNGGRMCGAQFAYGSPYADNSRYYALYNRLTTQYGSPVNYSNTPGNLSATWYGYDNGYITLSFAPSYGDDGIYRYYTLLSLGN